MKYADGWWWPDGEQHMLDWIADRKNRLMLNGRPAYQGKKQLAVLEACFGQRRTMVDVGAHIGLWAWNFEPYFNHIEAFEPVPAHRECFEKNVLEAAVTNVTLHGFALGDREGKVAIYSNPISSGDSWVKTGAVGKTPMRTLDSFKLADVDLIKVDCEGYEEFVLRGAENTLVTWKPVICVEQKRDMAAKFGLKPQGALAYLKTLGYSIEREIGGDFILRAAP
jgi:FkbM family methyltransferase